VDALDTGSATLRGVTRAVRRVWPRALRFGVLFCGLAVPAGDTHLRLAPGADAAEVATSLDHALRDLARREHASLVVIKELDAAADALWGQPLRERGYVRGDVPALYGLPGGFASFEQFRDRMRSDYRRKILRSQEKALRMGLRFDEVIGPAIAQAYTDEVHRLYLSVHDRSQYQLETLPASFFRAAGEAFGDAAVLNRVRRDGRVLAFSLGIAAGDVFHQLYAGYDASVNGEADLYFNVAYASLDGAFRRGAAEVRMGQTAGDFKARLGARPVPLSFYAAAVNPVTQLALRAARSRAFPAVENVPVRDVFKTEPDRLPRKPKLAARPAPGPSAGSTAGRGGT
jgi:predicted N-acyltransferase